MCHTQKYSKPSSSAWLHSRNNEVGFANTQMPELHLLDSGPGGLELTLAWIVLKVPWDQKEITFNTQHLAVLFVLS